MEPTLDHVAEMPGFFPVNEDKVVEDKVIQIQEDINTIKEASDGGNGDIDVDGATEATSGLDKGQAPEKRKKKRKKKVGKTYKAITGFEDNYVDTPITPDEFKEERELYSPVVPFTERMEECIIRYRARRRMDSTKNYLFDRYLLLGGIDSSQRQFTGMDPDVVKVSTTAEIRTMTARDVIHHGTAGSKYYDVDEAENWVVDFPAIAKGFLSREAPQVCPRSGDLNADMEGAAKLIENFLNYVIMHDVCPEYKLQLLEARSICQIAPTEYRNAIHLYRLLPGSFNNAARSLFCEAGAFKALENSPDVSVVEKKGWEIFDSNPTKSPSPFEQLVIFRLTVLDRSRDDRVKELATQDDPTQIKVVNTKRETYEVVSAKQPNKKRKRMLLEMLEKQGLADKVKPHGSVIVRPSIIDHAYSNLPRPDEVDFSSHPTETFFIEDDLLDKFAEGMKMHLEVCELNIGVSFIKECFDVKVSFDTFLPQSLMSGWKDPVENDRPAPSVDDPA